ncbi:fluoride efflux transporter CrcB [Nocardioides sp.]|uniref:fluoride efflux transporter CrcB n=1 Tax=Nocardioides sp. TaxID=35761 RepID=UPI0039E30AAC
MTAFLWVALGATLGAPARYLVDRAVQSTHQTRMPFGTLAVNVLGSLVLGLLVGAETGTTAALLIGTGFCGTLTTFSTFAFETVRLIDGKSPAVAFANLAGQLAGGLAAVALGYLAGSAL